MGKINYAGFIDSIRIRYNNLKLVNLYYEMEEYSYTQDEYGVYLFNKAHNNRVYNIFELQTKQDNTGIQYELLSFNGFKKYSERDNLLQDEFIKIITLLHDNGINFYITKFDYAIDIYDVRLEQLLETKKIKYKSTKIKSLNRLNEDELESIRTNRKSHYFEPMLKNKNDSQKRKVRAYLYNKSIKEGLTDKSVYRFEVSMNSFRESEEMSPRLYVKSMITEIEKRFSYYKFQCDEEQLYIDYGQILEMLKYSNQHFK